MNDVAVTVYTTQGIPIFEVGGNVPLDVLGIDYEKIDGLGIWLGLRLGRYSENAFIGMRVDQMFETGGRENRYIILLKVPKNSLLSGEFSVSDLLLKTINKLKELKGITYAGEIGTSKWEAIKKYAGDLIFVALTGEEKLIEAKIPELNYFEPTLMEREDALKLFLKIHEALPPEKAPELFVFSKSGSSEYTGIWLTEHGKDVGELKREAELYLERLKRDSEELKTVREDLKYCQERLAEMESRTYYYEEEEGGILSAIKSFAIILFAIFIGVGIGFLLIPMFYTPPLAPEGTTIVPAAPSALHETLNNIQSLETLDGKNSAEILKLYLSFINESQKTNSANMTELLDAVDKDVKVHRALLEKIKELETTTEGLKSLNLELNKSLSSLNQEISAFSETTEYFSKIAGSNVTLTKENIDILKKRPGIEGWNKAMTSYCKLAAVNRGKEVKDGISILKTETEAVRENVTGVYTILDFIYMNNQDDMNLANATKAFEDLQKSLTAFSDWLDGYAAEVDKNISKVTTCREAYLLTSGWNVQMLEDEMKTMINGSEAMGYIDRVIEAGIAGDPNVDPFVASLFQYARTQNALTEEEFVNAINNTLIGTNDPIEKISAFLKFLEETTGIIGVVTQ